MVTKKSWRKSPPSDPSMVLPTSVLIAARFVSNDVSCATTTESTVTPPTATEAARVSDEVDVPPVVSVLPPVICTRPSAVSAEKAAWLTVIELAPVSRIIEYIVPSRLTCTTTRERGTLTPSSTLPPSNEKGKVLSGSRPDGAAGAEGPRKNAAPL